VNTSTAGILIVAAIVVALAALVLVRRLLPSGGLFIEDSQAGGVFGVVGSGFAVLLAFVIFTGFNSYGSARTNAAVEAVAVRQMFRTSELFGEDDGDRLRADLVC